MYAEDSDFEESPRHSRPQGMRPPRRGGEPRIGTDDDDSDFEDLIRHSIHASHGPPRRGCGPRIGTDDEASDCEDLPRRSHHGHGPSRHGGRPDRSGLVPLSTHGHGSRATGSRPGHGFPGRDFIPRDFNDDDALIESEFSPSGGRYGHGPRAGHCMRGFDPSDPRGHFDDEDSEEDVPRPGGMRGPGRRDAVDHGRGDQGRRGATDLGHGNLGHGNLGLLELDDRGYGGRRGDGGLVADHGRGEDCRGPEDLGFRDLDLRERGNGGSLGMGPSHRHGSTRHGHSGHGDMSRLGGSGRRHGRHWS